MRQADRWLGRVVTVVLVLFDLLARRFRRPGSAGRHEPGRILVIKLVGLGDTVLMLTPLRKLRDAFPEARICALVTPLSTGILEGQPQIDELIVHDVLGEDRGFAGFIGLVKRLRRYHFDCVIDFEQHFQMTGIISYLTGARRRLGLYYPGNPRSRLLTDPVFLDPDIHMVDTYMGLLAPLGLPIEPVRTLERIFVDAADQREVEQWLCEHRRFPDAPLVGIHPGSGVRATARRWPKARFAEIVRRISEEYGADIVLTGGESEVNLVDEILEAARAEGAQGTAGRFNIKQTAALMAKCALFISNDTGPMHMAAAMGTPTVGLFGPNVPCRYGPVGQGSGGIYKGADCSPCIQIHKGRVEECDRAICMEAISVEEVWKAILRHDLRRETASNPASHPPSDIPQSE
jgi:lipopolysaccharide heptosyltransferase II